MALLLKFFLAAVGTQYLIVGILFIFNKQPGLAIAYLSYAIANVGLILSTN